MNLIHPLGLWRYVLYVITAAGAEGWPLGGVSAAAGFAPDFRMVVYPEKQAVPERAKAAVREVVVRYAA